MRSLILPSLLAGAALAAAPAHRSPRPVESVRTLAITARDYAFDAPDTVVAGRTLVRLANRGRELHHAYLVRLDEGKSLRDLAAALKAGGPPPAWAHDIGGPNAPAPGANAETVVTLVPGTYALLCVIPSADGTPHVMKGMARQIAVVTAPTAINASRTSGRVDVAAPDVQVVLRDYGFDLSRPLSAGRHVIHVSDAAPQSHELFIARLAPGKTAQALVTWIESMKGPPPAEPMGGAAPLAKGVSNDVLVDLEPGRYALYCFVPDAKDGKPHVMHGMLREITVK
jgi:uncharacterized cupredoxin-like copper-binding protein